MRLCSDMPTWRKPTAPLLMSFKCQLQETSPENVLHVSSWEEGGHSGASGNVFDPYQGLLQHPENDPSLQIG